MFPFKRIFNFEPATVARMEQRFETRYTPGAGFPLEAWLVLQGADRPARVVDLSGRGIGLRVDPGDETN